jgi:hypothetical protein
LFSRLQDDVAETAGGTSVRANGTLR